MLRLVVMALTAAGGGLALGRRALDKKVEERISAEVAAAQEDARAELNRHIDEVVREKLLSFALTLAVKGALLAFIFGLYAAEHLTSTGLRIAGSVMLVVFTLRDIARTVPYLAPAARLARAHGWSPKAMLGDLVGGVVFERAYARALVAAETKESQMWLALSRYNAESVSQEVARAVSEVVAQASYPHIRARALLAAGTAATLMIVYAGVIWALARAV